MSPRIIKTQKLYTWLLNVANAATGKGVGDMKHEELIGWIKAKHNVFTKEDFVISFEIFDSEFQKQLDILTNTSGIEPATEERICKELHALVKRSHKDTKNPLELITNNFHVIMNNDTKKNLEATRKLLKDGYRKVVVEIINNPAFNKNLALWGNRETADTKAEMERSPKKHKDKRKEKLFSPSDKSKASKGESKPAKEGPRPKCPGCGAYETTNHTKETCWWIKEKKKGYNPNYETESWDESEAGKKAKREGKDYLPRLSKKKDTKKKGTECVLCLSTSSCNTCNLILNFLSNNNKANLPFIDSILISQERRMEQERKKGIETPEVRPFLDTGASGDFISNEFADLLIKENFKIEKLNSSCRVGLASHDNCLRAHNLIKFELVITDEFGITSEIEVNAYIVPIKYSIILGLPTIKRYNLTYRYPSIFANEEKQDELFCKPCDPEVSKGGGNKPIRTLRVTSSSTNSEEIKEREEDKVSTSDSQHPVAQEEGNLRREDNPQDTKESTLPGGWGSKRDAKKFGSPVIWWDEKNDSAEIAELSSNFSTKLSFDIDDLSERRGARIEAIPEEMLRAEEEEIKLPDLRHLQNEQRERVEGLLKDFKDLFRTRVTKKGANVTPYELKVNLKGWRVSKNRGRPRRMSHSCEIEMRRQIDLLLLLGVIRPSRAGYYSHGFMVPKPGGKQRLVVDFNLLNLESEAESGRGIPNIKDIFERLGEKKSHFFCKIDLTSGVHQTYISEESIPYTAFKTLWGGSYEWCRLPMGLKGAPAYFQQIMATEVLGGLVMDICEVYLDDVIVFAPREEILLEGVRIVLERFREKGMTLNPEKCTMCVSQVE